MYSKNNIPFYTTQKGFVESIIPLINMSNRIYDYKTWIFYFEHILYVLHANKDYYKHETEVVNLIREKIMDAITLTNWRNGYCFMKLWD